MIGPFTHESLPMRVMFGAGSVAGLEAEAERQGMSRALVLGTPRRGQALASNVATALGARAAGVHAAAVMHTPVDVTERTLQVVRDARADALIAVGGGSTINLAKAVALRAGLPWIAVPTTYAGSEMTTILGETEGGVKTTRRTPKVLPAAVVYDIDLTLTLPAGLSAASGLNAIAHAVEALYAPDGSPVVSLLAEAGIAALAGALPTVVAAPDDRDGRSDALYGAWLCGISLGAVGMGLHHKLCHVLGGTFDLPHAQTHATVLPHAVAYNARAAPEAMVAVARALGSADAAQGLHELNAALGIDAGLRDLGMPPDGLDAAADRIASEGCTSPRPVDRGAIRDLLGRAWRGDPPQP